MAAQNKSDDLTQQKDRVTAISGTIVLVAVLIVMLLILGFRSTTTINETEGAYVLLGVTEFGSPGDNTSELSQLQPEQPTIEQPSQPVTTETPVISQEVEASPVTVQKTEEKKNTPTETTQPVKEEKKANPKFQFQKGNNTSGVKGNTSTPGDQGSTNGSIDAKRFGPGGGPEGYSYSLSNRNVLLAPPKIEDNTQQVEKVVIEIAVNKNGTVVSAKATFKNGGSTVTGPLVEKAISAAMKTKFSPKADAPEEQYGTITFNFVLQ